MRYCKRSEETFHTKADYNGLQVHAKSPTLLVTKETWAEVTLRYLDLEVSQEQARMKAKQSGTLLVPTLENTNTNS